MKYVKKIMFYKSVSYSSKKIYCYMFMLLNNIKRKENLVVILLLLFIFVSCDQSEISNNNVSNYSAGCSLNKLNTKYSKVLLLKAISRFGEDIGFEILQLSTVDYFEYDSLMVDILKKNPNIVNDLCVVIEERQNSEEIYKKIIAWCQSYVILTLPSNLDEVIISEDVIEKIPILERIIQSFLTIKEQSVSSLSESQLIEVDYKVCDYLCTLNNKDRIIILSVYLNKISSHME